MPLKIFVRIFPCLIIVTAMTLMASCSDNPDPGAVTTTFPLVSPARFAEKDATTLLVSDYAGQAIHLVDKQSLEPIQSISFKGQPTGVLSSGGQYYVANKSTRSIDVLDAQGNLLYHLGSQTGLFLQINDIDIDELNGLIYAVDTKAGLIKVFDLNNPDTAPTEIGATVLINPTALFFDQMTRRLYVSDFGDAPNGILPRIHILDADGMLIGAIVASPGGMMGTQSFSTPQGLFVDADGLLYMVDALSSEIQIYDLSTNRMVKTFGQSGSSEGALFYPLDLFVEAGSKDVYVADNRNGRIVLFPAGGVLP